MIFEEYIPNNRQEFIDKVDDIAAKLLIDPDWLMAVMYFESRLNPQAKNKNSTAVGLIQFVESTAQSLGTSTAALLKMNNLQQLDYVYKYFKRYEKDLRSFGDCYLAVFWPGALNQPDSYKIGGAKVANSNAIFDLDKNGQITKGEVLAYVYDWVNQRSGYTFPEAVVYAPFLEEAKKKSRRKTKVILLSALAIAALGYYGYKNRKKLGF